jgi:hypothetical protein
MDRAGDTGCVRGNCGNNRAWLAFVPWVQASLAVAIWRVSLSCLNDNQPAAGNLLAMSAENNIEIYGSWLGQTAKITIKKNAFIRAMVCQAMSNKSKESYEVYNSIHAILLSDESIENMLEEMRT